MLQSQDRGVTGFTDSCSIPKAAVCQPLCGATNLVCEGEKLDPAFSLSLKLFLLIAKTTFCYFSCVQTSRGLWISSGADCLKMHVLCPYLNNYGNLLKLFCDSRLSGNGNKHLCLSLWSDAVPFDPVLSERDLKKQAGRRSDRPHRRRLHRRRLSVSQTAGGGDTWRQQTCYAVIRLAWSSNDITEAPPQLIGIQRVCVRAHSCLPGILRTVHTFPNKRVRTCLPSEDILAGPHFSLQIGL